MPPSGGDICGTGSRRRNPEGGNGDCGCKTLDAGVCLEYYDNCCEPPSSRGTCCNKADGCTLWDPACSISPTATTTSTTLACPWLEPTDEEDKFECVDGERCANVTCCADHGGRARCPLSLPHMCSDRTCGQLGVIVDYCCARQSCEDFGGPRLCLGNLGFAGGLTHTIFFGGDGIASAVGLLHSGAVGSATVDSLTPWDFLNDAIAVDTGTFHTLVLRDDGVAFAFGSNSHGQLGDGTTSSRAHLVAFLTAVTAVAAEGHHSVVLRADATAWATGWNAYGQLADGTMVDKHSPIKVMDGVQAIATGSTHTVFLQMDGNVWAAGINSNGQLADSSTQTRTSPVKVLTQVRSISCGLQHTIFVREDNWAWAVGYNSHGQLGDGSNQDRYEPVRVLSGVDKIAAGGHQSFFVRLDATAWATGFNSYGQLGDGTMDHKYSPVEALGSVYDVFAGEFHTFFLRSDGQAFTCGRNFEGQLGIGASPTKVLTPVRVFESLFPWVKTTTATTTTTGRVWNAYVPTLPPNTTTTQAQARTDGDDEGGDDAVGIPKDNLLGALIGPIIGVAAVWLVACASCAYCIVARYRRRGRVGPTTVVDASGVRPQAKLSEPVPDTRQGEMTWRTTVEKARLGLSTDAEEAAQFDALRSPVHHALGGESSPGPPLALDYANGPFGPGIPRRVAPEGAAGDHAWPAPPIRKSPFK